MVVTNVNSNYVILLKFWVDIHLWGKKAQSFRTPWFCRCCCFVSQCMPGFFSSQCVWCFAYVLLDTHPIPCLALETPSFWLTWVFQVSPSGFESFLAFWHKKRCSWFTYTFSASDLESVISLRDFFFSFRGVAFRIQDHELCVGSLLLGSHSF